MACICSQFTVDREREKTCYKMYLILLGILAVTGGVVSHTYHLGACPVVEPMPGFEMNKVSLFCLWVYIRVHWGLLYGTVQVCVLIFVRELGFWGKSRICLSSYFLVLT